MGDPRGFLRVDRQKNKLLPIAERVRSYAEFEIPLPPEELRAQASRCMDCGIPFCHQGCPLGNLIPEWNDHVYRDRRVAARHALLETNNFPEITGRVCPAPCEAACVLNIDAVPVTIKDIEHAIANDIIEAGLTAEPPTHESGLRVAVVGSGPAGLAAAQQLRRRGHAVVVFEKDARAGGLLRYGIPDFKLDKGMLDQRLEQMREEGVQFQCNTQPTAAELRAFDGIVLATGARKPRDLEVPGRQLDGVHFAMDFLKMQNERVGGERDLASGLSAGGKHVVVLGGGDTGSDCVGTSHRQGALSVTALELLPEPPGERAPGDLWPAWPRVFRTSSSHEEGGSRLFAIRTEELVADASGTHVAGLRVTEVRQDGRAFVPVAGTERLLPADLVLLAMGFVAVEENPLYAELGVQVTATGRLVVPDPQPLQPELDDDGARFDVVVCGDAYRGASLVVWAIADGRNVARQLDASLLRKQAL